MKNFIFGISLGASLMANYFLRLHLLAENDVINGLEKELKEQENRHDEG